MYEDQLPPVRQFHDLESPILHNAGRVAVYESFGFDEKPIVVTCRKVMPGGHEHMNLYADVGYLKTVEVTREVRTPGKGKQPDQVDQVKGHDYEICFRSHGQVHRLPGNEYDQDQARAFACEFGLASFGETKNYLEDVAHQPRPMLAQTRDVLVKFGLVDEKSLPKKRAPKPTQTHGGRGNNAATIGEIQDLTGVTLGA